MSKDNHPTYEISEEFKNNTLFLLVENTVFSVNRNTFIDDSEFFKELFELPAEKGKPVEGSSIEHPLFVEGVRKEDIVSLLRAMYPRYIGDTYSTSCEQWVSLLELLTLWCFNNGRERVLKNLLASADLVTKILLYEQYNLDAEEWLIPAVNTFAHCSTHKPAVGG